MKTTEFKVNLQGKKENYQADHVKQYQSAVTKPMHKKYTTSGEKKKA